MKLKKLCAVISLSCMCSTFNAHACDDESLGDWLDDLIQHTLPVDLLDVPNNPTQPDCESGPKKPDPETDYPQE
ncbi:hypothetical protein [Alteromonas sp. a30]|uniref:hypothetical protein n=1 Tax=Alteromonas sp. a30 TaxID=2730917 RepID=UPI002282A15B|nr:hypothetical protein [Alteromonas sp. a30]MCY7295084.1 hypothetical protein [Alteromonas sp. a30]